MAVYQRLRDLREDTDMTQKQVADKLFLHLTQYRRYETGASELPMDIAVRIADIYNVSLDYIAGRSIHRHGDNQPDFSSEEIQMINLYRSLSERCKGRLELYAEILINSDGAILTKHNM